MSSLRIHRVGNALQFAIRVQPRASANEVTGIHGDALKVRVTAAPTDGSANAAVVQLIADLLDVPRRAVRIVSGATSRAKVIAVEGVTPSRVQQLASGRAR